MTGMLRIPRSRGALSGALLILLGLWGALIPLVGPYASFAYTPDQTWTVTAGRVWLEILPGAAAILGGMILLITSLRPAALLGACLAILAGAWFTVGTTLAPLWTTVALDPGSPVGGQVDRVLEQVSFFTGLGAVIICVASVILGRLTMVSARDLRPTGPAESADLIGSTTSPAEHVSVGND